MIPITKTDGTIPQPERILNIIAVAKNLIPSASNRVIRKIMDDNF